MSLRSRLWSSLTRRLVELTPAADMQVTHAATIIADTAFAEFSGEVIVTKDAAFEAQVANLCRRKLYDSFRDTTAEERRDARDSNSITL